MKTSLIILSDMWGWRKSDWIKLYISLLEPCFDIKLYDSGLLANVDYSYSVEKQIHTQFIETGIDLAVKTIVSAETEKVNVLGFSIGGTIAWKAGINGLDTEICSLFHLPGYAIRFKSPIVKSRFILVNTTFLSLMINGSAK